MKSSIFLKVVLIPSLAVLSCLTTAHTALADYLTSQGSGGNYRYELWSSDDNGSYYLKIWSIEASTNSKSYITTPSFDSSREALIYFDCNYAEKILPECPR
ncbi:hypothetical protein H6G33_29520 [Calothrix sp. FACHB-1219]|uniref:hypothetical protein n=1 Tax=unclassified Calothrix TaxID=2619626 RepID=UPI001682704F|nr:MULTISPECIES: hypothetical protein [unclassified Calothrix]MBD2206337.1 hypothetical protein [Calothrix sp. FACHB-168]MBD2221119.1 hypothetical protein [Calothrix sp. FACHB-1219]